MAFDPPGDNLGVGMLMQSILNCTLLPTLMPGLPRLPLIKLGRCVVTVTNKLPAALTTSVVDVNG